MTDNRTLEQRLQALEDREGIQRTLDQYTRAMDLKDAALLKDCFTPDGVWRTSVAGKWAGTGGMALTGHAELEEWVARRKPPTPGHMGRHFSVSPVIRLNGDTATCESYFCAMHETESGPLVFAFGRYIDQFQRSPDGRWRMRERHLSRDSVDKSAQDKIIGQANQSGDKAANSATR